MHIIAFVAQKGGAGKSTLVSSLAVAALQAGERVFIFDLDPLQSLVKWSRARELSGVPIEPVAPGALGERLTEIKDEGVTLAIVDTPGADTDCVEDAIRAADLCVIPVRPNAFDLWASEATLAKVKANRKEYAFLLNQCPPTQQSARIDRAANSLQEMGALLAPLISLRVDYQNAARLGLGVSELNPNGVAAHEMRELWSSVRRRLDKSDAAEPAATETRGSIQAQSYFAKVAYEAFVAEAVKIQDMYFDFAKALFERREVEAPSTPAANAPSTETDSNSPEG
jgi:chromosome partitioning protein